MSLHSVLSQTIRPTLSATVLNVCLEADRVVVENIAMVALDVISLLNIPATMITRAKTTYELSIPITVDSIRISIDSLQKIKTYSPARIHDVFMHIEKQNKYLVIVIGDERNITKFSETDIVRINKRSR